MIKRKNKTDIRIGVDIVFIPRIREILNSTDGRLFIKRCFDTSEISESRKRKKREEFLAGRFALKEALIKLNGERNGIRFSEIKVSNKRGRPVVSYSGKTEKILGRYDISCSISHDGDYAIAVAIGRMR